jgi:hypothetical protein
MHQLTTTLEDLFIKLKPKLKEGVQKKVSSPVLIRPTSKGNYRVWKDGLLDIVFTTEGVKVDLKIKEFVSDSPLSSPALLGKETSMVWSDVLLKDYQIASVGAVIISIKKLVQ